MTSARRSPGGESDNTQSVIEGEPPNTDSDVELVLDDTDSVIEATTDTTVRVLEIVISDPARRTRRSTKPADLLSRRLDSVCTTAVDSLEIAAAIEAEGVNDHMALSRYEEKNVFSLAVDIHERVPLRPKVHNGVRHLDESPASRDIARGLLFVLPGALYIAAIQGFVSPEATYALLGSLVFAWVWGQGSSYLGHVLVGRGASRSARTLVLSMSVAGIAVVTATSWILATVYALHMEIVAISGIQTTYLLAASVLLLFKKEIVLFAILVPGATATVATMLLDGRLGQTQVTNIVITATIAIVGLAAVVATRKATNKNPGLLTGHDYIAAVPHMALGLTWASLVSLTVLVPIVNGSIDPLLGLTIVPLLLSMGVAEWSLRHYLRLSRGELHKIRDPAVFAAATRRATWRTLGGYTATLLVLTAGTAFVIQFVWTLTINDGLMLISYALLGAAFLLGQMLTSRSRIAEAIVISASALVMLVVLINTMGPDGFAFAYLYSTLFLALALLIRALMTSGKVTEYR